jgi:FkbM family methyltransferase
MKQNPQVGNVVSKTLSTPPVPVKTESGALSLQYRKLLDLAAEGLCKFIRSRRPKICSASQCGQDLFVIDKIFHRKRRGFFLEIGGGDGLYLSNTLVLERDFEWRGILVEPTGAFESMLRNRPKAICEHSAIAGSRKTVRLFEILDKGQAGMNPEAAGSNTLMSVTGDASVEEPDFRGGEWGAVQKSYLVNTITLDDLLTKHHAPHAIDYFSFDVEGAEYEILKDFPFEKWTFNCLGIETPSRELDNLLRSNNYTLIKTDILDWFYLHRNFLDEWLDKLA